MSAQENKEKARRLLEEAFGQGKLEVIDEVLDPNFVCYDPNSESGEVRGADTFKGEIEYFRQAVPDLTYTVEEQVAEGDKVVTRWTVRGTQKGELMGIPPTGKQVTMSGVVVDRLSNGRLLETWIQADTLGMLQQLGVVQVPAGRAA